LGVVLSTVSTKLKLTTEEQDVSEMGLFERTKKGVTEELHYLRPSPGVPRAIIAGRWHVKERGKANVKL
jgi:hypothetical protein